MRPVSSTFLAAVSGSHKIVTRATLLTDTQFGTTPTGTVIPILDGDVKLTATADVKATLDLTTEGTWWDQVQPYGTEVYLERGVDYGNGTREFVGLGYFTITDVEQDDAPRGPIRISGSDRNFQMQQNRVLYPYQVPSGTTHRTMFGRLVNGDQGGGQSTAGYGMYIYTPVPITWTGYNPDTTLVPDGSVVKDSTYDFLAELAAQKGCVLRFDATGQLTVVPTDVASAAPVYTITSGQLGTLVKVSRSSTRRDVYNIVSAYGSDPSFPTSYSLAYNEDPNSPIRWAAGYPPYFGAAPRYYASPLLHDDAACLSAAQTLLSRYTGLPTTLSVFTVPNPALEPLDVIAVRISPTVTETHVIEQVSVPLTADGQVQIDTRTLNTVEAPSS